MYINQKDIKQIINETYKKEESHEKNKINRMVCFNDKCEDISSIRYHSYNDSKLEKIDLNKKQKINENYITKDEKEKNPTNQIYKEEKNKDINQFDNKVNNFKEKDLKEISNNEEIKKSINKIIGKNTSSTELNKMTHINLQNRSKIVSSKNLSSINEKNNIENKTEKLSNNHDSNSNNFTQKIKSNIIQIRLDGINNKKHNQSDKEINKKNRSLSSLPNLNTNQIINNNNQELKNISINPQRLFGKQLKETKVLELPVADHEKNNSKLEKIDNMNKLDFESNTVNNSCNQNGNLINKNIIKNSNKNNFSDKNINDIKKKLQYLIISESNGPYIYENFQEILKNKTNLIYNSEFIMDESNRIFHSETHIKNDNLIDKNTFKNVQLVLLKKENKILGSILKSIENFFDIYIKRKDERGNFMIKGTLNSNNFNNLENYFNLNYKSLNVIEVVQFSVYLFKWDIFYDYNQYCDKTNLSKEDMNILISNYDMLKILRDFFSNEENNNNDKNAINNN